MTSSMNNEEFLSLMERVAKEKGIDLDEEKAGEFINIFSESLREALCNYPNVSVDNLGHFSISRLSDRKRVLRNTVYWTKTFYKVRFYVDQSFQDALYETYEPGADLDDL